MVSGVTFLKVCFMLNLNDFWQYFAEGMFRLRFLVFLCMNWQLVRTNFGCVDNGWGLLLATTALIIVIVLLPLCSVSPSVCPLPGICLVFFFSCHRIWFVWLVQFTCSPVCFHWEKCQFPPGNMSISTGKLVHFSVKECNFFVFLCFHWETCLFPPGNMAISTGKHGHFHWEACPFLCKKMCTIGAVSLFSRVFPLGVCRVGAVSLVFLCLH